MSRSVSLSMLPAAWALLAATILAMASPALAQSAPAAAAPGPGAAAHEWPQWRGPLRTGVSAERGWSSEGRSESVWSRNVGLGYSSFAVGAGRVYTMGYDEAKSADVLYCLDAVSGANVWTHEIPSALNAMFHGGGSLATPALDGDAVYATNHAGKGLCLRAADGQVVWSIDLAKELGAAESFHGYSGSPFVLGAHLIVSLGGRTAALEKRTGELIWQTRDYGEGSYSTPIDMDLEGRPCLAVFNGAGLAVIDRSNGAELRFHPWKSGQGVNVATPVVMGQRLFISSGYEMGCALLDAASDPPAVLWQSKVMRNKMTGCVLWEDHLYGFDESMLKCIDLEGNERWRMRGLGMGALMAADGRLILLSSKGELIIARASPREYQELSRAKALEGGVYWSSPVLAGGRIYCRNSLGDIACRDHRTAPAPAANVAAAPRGAGDLPAAAALFRRHLEAIGGEEALRRHTSMRLTGTISISADGANLAPLEIVHMAPARALLRYDLGQFGSVVECFDGRIGWRIHPFWGNTLIEGDALREMESTSGFYDAAESASVYRAMRTSGRAEFGGRACFVVQTQTSGGSTRNVYFDVTTGLMAGRDGAIETMVVLDDYRDFQGLRLPARRTVLEAGTGTERTIVIDGVTFGDVDASAFDSPEPIRWLLMSPEEIAAADTEARASYGEYLGRYLANFHGFVNTPLTITAFHGRLALEIPGMRTYELEPPDATGRFVLMNMPAFGVSFQRDEAGTVTTMLFHDGDASFPAPRMNEGGD